MKQAIFLLFVIVSLVNNVWCRQMSRCQVAKELLNQGFPRNQLNDWVCLVMAESNGNTAAIHYGNSDGSNDYGLFQINNRYWCENGRRGKECNVDCNDLLKDDISEASQCAKKIYAVQGFSAWTGWTNKCSNGRAPSVDDCF